MNNIKIKTIQRKIKQYYENNRRTLPWRVNIGEKQDPYKTLVSEMMLQQTRVKTVLTYYKNFLKEFPNIKALALAKEDKVLKAWSGMGYYRRATNLHKTAKIILKDYNGNIPEEQKELITLPGIGFYTSSAISSFAFGHDEIVIDTNVERFIRRVLNIDEKKSQLDISKSYAKIIFPKKDKGSFAQAIMDFSNQYCIKINPKCNVCFISRYCNFIYKKQVKNINVRKKIKFCTSYFILDKDYNFFVRKRKNSKILKGLYEIPSTSWQEEKDTETYLLNANKKDIIVLKKIIKHEFSHFSLISKIIIIKKKNIHNFNLQGKWVTKESLEKLPISSLTRKIANYSLEELSSLKEFL